MAELRSWEWGQYGLRLSINPISTVPTVPPQPGSIDIARSSYNPGPNANTSGLRYRQLGAQGGSELGGLFGVHDDLLVARHPDVQAVDGGPGHVQRAVAVGQGAPTNWETVFPPSGPQLRMDIAGAGG
jgi:hypothetical protein